MCAKNMITRSAHSARDPAATSRLRCGSRPWCPGCDPHVLCDADGRSRSERPDAPSTWLQQSSDLDGGVAAWRAAGHPLFTTTHVLAKTFGGVAERAVPTPHITARELKAKLDAGEDVAIFDARSFAESTPAACRVRRAVRLPNFPRSGCPAFVRHACGSTARAGPGAFSARNRSESVLPNLVVVLENGACLSLAAARWLRHPAVSRASHRKTLWPPDARPPAGLRRALPFR